MLSSEQKDALKSIFRSSGFTGYLQGKYNFTGGRKATTITNFLKNLGAPDCFEEIPCLLPLALAVAKKAIPSEDLLEVIREYTEENKRSVPTIPDLEDEEEENDLTPYFRTLIPTINITRNAKEKVILLDPSKGYRPVLDVDTEFYFTVVGTTWRDLVCNEEVLKVMTVFDPYKLEYIFRKESKSGSISSIHHVNYYVPPRWRFLKAEAKFEGFIKELIYHLFPNEDELEYVLDWMHYAIVKRNETVLCLVGSRGTGKGILIKDILGALIGNEYFEIAKQDLLIEKFNAEFKNKRLVFFDEVNISGEKELNRFKQLANDRISMEAKGEDAETIDNFTSMALSSNDKKEFRAEPQERRFSVPEVTEEPLLNSYSEEEIEAAVMRFKDPESVEIAEFGNWLMQRVPKSTPQRPLKGKYYFELCRLSMKEWKLFIVEYFLDHGEIGVAIPCKNLQSKFAQLLDKKDDDVPWPKSAGIEVFLGDYFHEAACRIGKLVETKDKGHRPCKGIMPNEEFLRKFGKKYQEEKAEDAL